MAVPVLEELRNPTSSESLLQALKVVKNDIVGHSHRKELWIRKGVVVHLKRILDTHRTSSKRKQRDDSTEANGAPDTRSGQDEARLQAITIIGSLAHGGPAFITPLRLAQTYLPLLHIISPMESSPQIVLAALRCLNAIADAVAREDVEERKEAMEFLHILYTDLALNNLNQILSQESASPVIQQQIVLAAELIAKTSTNERRRKQIKVSGLMSTLAVRLASFVVASQLEHKRYRRERAGDSRVLPASPKAKLDAILHAICVVIADSKIRASIFCCDSVWASVFPNHRQDPYAGRVPAVNAFHSESSNLDSWTSPPTSVRSKSTNHPPLGPWANPGRLKKPMSIPYGNSEKALPEGFRAGDDDETPLVAWLIDIVKTKDGFTRLMAIWLTGLLFRSQMICVKRQKSLSMFLVPVLVNMLDSEVQPLDSTESMNAPSSKSTRRLTKELAPRVLALFMQDNESLQKGAAEGGAIKKLSQLLKQSFDPIPTTLLTPEWNAHDAEGNNLEMEASESSVLGRPGIHPIIYHTLQVRESLLIAISAMATLTDSYRQAIVDDGVLPFVIESLKPKESQAGHSYSDYVKPGNSVSTLVAACSAARTLSRSVAALRTSLVDAGLAKPIYTLLKHNDLEVQIAATGALANIILPFSSMRQDVTEAGILQVLCEHAHSSDSRLRISALWALGSFAVHANNHFKIQVVRGLSPGWLKHVICVGNGEGFDSDRSHESNGFGLSTSNASGEKVDILNSDSKNGQGFRSNTESNGDVDMIDEDEPNESAQRMSTANISSHEFSGATDEYFDARTDERIYAIQAARDDLAVQEQGLNLMRNLLCGGSEISEIVDYLFLELGQDNLFDIFTNLLRPKSQDAFHGQDYRSIPSTKMVPPPTEIVCGVCYILVHIAGSGPRHKQVILAQTELLRLLIPLYTHPLPEVRVALIWLVINICWKEDNADREGAASRARELKELGIVAKIHDAANDTDLDVRERAKSAIATLNDLMRE